MIRKAFCALGLWLAITAFTTGDAVSQILTTADMEDGIMSLDDYAPLYFHGNSPIIVAAENGITPRRGSYMLSSYLNRYVFDVANYRTEAVISYLDETDAINYEKGQEYWVGLSIHLSNNWDMDYSNETNPAREDWSNGIVFQFHNRNYLNPDGRALLPFVILHTKDGWQLVNIVYADSEGDRGTLILFNETVPFKRDEWNDFVVHVKFSGAQSRDDTDGFMQVWYNDSLVLDMTGQNYFGEQGGAFSKMGLYHAPWKLSAGSWSENVVYAVNERQIYHDELRVRGASSTYEDVAPSQGTTIRSAEVTGAPIEPQLLIVHTGKQWVRLTINGPYESLRIFDVDGRVVKTWNHNGSNSIAWNVNSFTNGIHVAKLETIKGPFFRRFFILK